MKATSILAEIVRDAAIDGDSKSPLALINALQGISNPIDALFKHDEAERLVHALIADIGYFPNRSIGLGNPDEHARQSWIALLRWFRSEIGRWKADQDPSRQGLAAILVTAHAADIDGTLWELTSEWPLSGELIAAFKIFIASLSISFAAMPGRGGVPIWEGEFVEKFKTADERGDWAAIPDAIRRFDTALHFGLQFPVSQSARCLIRSDPRELADAAKGLRQTIAVIQIARVLDVSACLRLALASSNPYVEFGCIFDVLTRRQPAHSFASDDLDALKNVLLKVSCDSERWPSWMCAFNTYPSRYPDLQEPLGLALAAAPERAVHDYVLSIQLTPQMLGRDLGLTSVSHCLRAFRNSAASERRALLWSLAFERWQSWDFGRQFTDSHLTGIVRSQLDYAIVGFAFEVISSEERDVAISKIRSELQSIELRWFASHTDIIAAWYRLLSRLQPYVIAAQSHGPTSDWVVGLQISLPFEPQSNRYAIMRFLMDDLIRSSKQSNEPAQN